MKKVGIVFWGSFTLVMLAVLVGVLAPQTLENVTKNIQNLLTYNFGWYYLLVVSIIIAFCVFLILSPVGAIRLGKPTDRPEYSNASWFAMLFSAGMGIGLVFWGAAEPLSHFAISSPEAPEGSQQALKDSFRYTYFHWGISAWAIYGVVALALAYFNFRKGAPGLISSTLFPLFGEKTKGPLGHTIDVIAVFATVVGVATTLGLGAQQINGGLAYLFNLPINFTVQLIIIAIVTVLFIISASTGLDKGIQILSNGNLYLAAALLLLTLFIGPTVSIMNDFTSGLGNYLQNFVQMSLRMEPGDAGSRDWINGWTIFYWAWWMSWSPFVGIFIARISKGRTIREFLMGVILAPTLVSIFWFATFGTTAIETYLTKDQTIVDLPTEQVLFGVFDQLPLGFILSIVALLLIMNFFITSADSATFVLGMQTTFGSMNPSFKIKLIWGVLQAAIAASLLFSGGLTALQNAAIIVAFPFSLIILLMILSLYKSLMAERKKLGLYIRPKKQHNSDGQKKDG
ncbi:BCCT family transporter [Solibacillus isronensis]|uniref:glycine betaine uptake BCCT transporter n=1 Tax=Solibacillus isronensis TaxID=412383 RepID=UPI0039A10A69